MTAGINDLQLRDEITDEVPSELPEQGAAPLPTLLPGISLFRIPSTVAQCIEAFDVEEKDAQGQVIMVPSKENPAQMVPKVMQRLRMNFDRDNPLIVVGGPNDGQPVTVKISNVPRNRARRNEAPILVAEATYLLRVALGYDPALPLNSPKTWVNAFVWTAGKVFRAEHGLSAHCRADKVRYINDDNDASGRGSIQDPNNVMGCDKRYYTSKFKLPAAQGGGFSDIMYCDCGAKLRGFFQFERFLAPLPGQNG